MIRRRKTLFVVLTGFVLTLSLWLAGCESETAPVSRDKGFIELDDLPLGEVVGLLSPAVRIDWDALRDAGFDGSETVTVRLRDCDPTEVLDAIVRSADGGKGKLDWAREHGGLVVSTRDAIERRRAVHRRIGALVSKPGVDGEAARRLSTPLQQVSFRQARLEEIITHLRDVSGAKVSTDWEAMEASGVAPSTRVTVHMEFGWVAEALDYALVCAGRGRAELAWLIRDGVVVISTSDKLQDHAGATERTKGEDRRETEDP